MHFDLEEAIFQNKLLREISKRITRVDVLISNRKKALIGDIFYFTKLIYE